MTITMTTKNQVTLPKKVVEVLDLHKGSMFDVKIEQNRIELIPVEVIEKVFTDEEYAKMDKILKREKKFAKKVTPEYINSITTKR